MTEPKKSGRWKKGESGNPNGRKPGTGDVAKLREAIAERVPEMLLALTEQALAGDVGAARLLLERVLPPLRPVEQAVPVAMGTGTMSDQAYAVLAAVGAGAISPSQAAQLLGAISDLAKIVEVNELEQRIASLEARHGAT